MAKVINIHIGKVHVSRDRAILKALLGSCIGIGFIWRSKNIIGLAHCLLPEAPEKTFEIGARFVDQAVDSLIALMKISENQRSEVEAVIAGGGNMTSPSHSGEVELIGDKNSKRAIAVIEKLGIKIAHLDVGGQMGRRLILDGADYSYRIEIIPKLSEKG